MNTTSASLVAGEATDEETVEPSTNDPTGLIDLLSRASNGDQSAWNQIVDRFAGMVWAIVRSYRLDEATSADVSQTTWLRFVEHLDRIERPEWAGGWLATTARRESVRAIRKAERQLPTGEDFDLIPDPS